MFHDSFNWTNEPNLSQLSPRRMVIPSIIDSVFVIDSTIPTLFHIGSCEKMNKSARLHILYSTTCESLSVAKGSKPNINHIGNDKFRKKEKMRGNSRSSLDLLPGNSAEHFISLYWATYKFTQRLRVFKSWRPVESVLRTVIVAGFRAFK